MNPTHPRTFPLLLSGPQRLLHGGDYNPEQWLHRQDLLTEDPLLMRQARMNEASVGVFAWSELEPQRDRFEFTWLDTVMDRLHGAGIGVLLATPMATRPRWLAEAHPDVMRMDSHGRRDQPGSGRHNPCWTSPELRERGTLIIARLAQRYAQHPALLGWHIDNEIGGTSESARCFCERCVGAFQGWLRKRYDHDLDALNQAWWSRFWSHTYTAWEQIRPGDGTIEALPLNWRRFCSEQMIGHVGLQIAEVRRFSDKPVTTNFFSFDKFDHRAMAAQLDFSSYDSYPVVSGAPGDRDEVANAAFMADITRGLLPGRPWLLIESCPSVVQWGRSQRLKRPGVHRFLSLAMVAQGSDGVCYFQWRAGRGGMEKLHGAVVMQDAPHDTRVFREVSALGRELATLSGMAGASVEARLAVIWDVESNWARELNSGLTTVSKPWDLALGWHRAAWDSSLDIDVVDATTPLDRYRVIVVPGVFLLRPGFVELLERAVSAGAQVIVDALSAWVDSDLACVNGGRPGPLRTALRLRCEEFDQLHADEHLVIEDPHGWLPAGTTVIGWMDRVHAGDCEILAKTTGGFQDGWPLLTRRKHGAGSFWYLAGDIGQPARAHLLGRLCELAAVEPCLRGLPAGVVARQRSQPDRRYVTLLNTTDTQAKITIPPGWRDVVSDLEVDADLILSGWDVRILTSGR